MSDHLAARREDILQAFRTHAGMEPKKQVFSRKSFHEAQTT
jgi:hypothetical protein